MKRFDARWWDSALLVLLVVAMCGQIDPFTLGRDTFKSEGFVTKQLKVALCDLVLFAVFVWFVGRTAQLRSAMRRITEKGAATPFKLWWPPLPCWALLLALLVSVVHSPHVVEAVVNYFHPSPDLSGEARHRLLQAPKEAIAEVVQFAGYFLIAPWLFVNLLHDRREGVLVSRRSMALWAFAMGFALNLAVSFVQLAKDGVPRGLWGTSNIYSSFLAVAVPLLWARALSGEAIRLRFARSRPRGLGLALAASIAALLTMVTPFTAVAQGFGMALSSTMRASARGLALTLLVVFFAAWSWRALATTALYTARTPYLAWKETTGESRGEVQKQWIEWYAAQGWSDPKDATFATGVGPGNYQLNIGKYYVALPNKKKMPPDSNNFYLVQGVSLGVVGLAALLWVLGHFAGQARAAAEAFRADWLGAGVFAALAAWFFINLFHALLVRGLGLVLAFLLALAIVARLSNEAARGESAHPVQR